MIEYLGYRLLGIVPVLLIVTLATFGLRFLMPGDPAIVIAGVDALPGEVEQIRQDLDLDRPVTQQAIRWYSNLLHGDLGKSLLLNRPVAQLFAERIGITLQLTLLSMTVTIVLAVSAGLVAAVRRNSWVDWLVMTAALAGVSLPNFWFGLILIYLFSVRLGWLPTGGYEPLSAGLWPWLSHMILPALVLSTLQMGLLARITRSSVLEVLRQDYVRTARASGIREGLVYGKYVLKNALIPVITVIGITFGLSLGGAVVVEQVFSVPGIGRLVVSAVQGRDYPVIQGALLITALLFVLINLAVDLVYAWVDPRVKYGHDR